MDGEQKIFQAYDWAYQRIHQYDNLIANRTNSFLFSSSILFTGFILLFVQSGENAKPLICVISGVGIILSILNMFNQMRGVRELRFWSSVCRVIEEEEDSFDPLREKQLVYIGYLKWIDGKPNKYTQEYNGPEYKAIPLDDFEKSYLYSDKFPRKFFHEWYTYRYIIPGFFAVLWVAALVCTFICK